MALCREKEQYLKNLRLVNLRADVDPELVDLLVAYAGMRLENNRDVNFFQDDVKERAGKHPYLLRFLQKNKETDPRALNFLVSYFLELKTRGIPCVFNRQHLADTLGISLVAMDELAQNSPKYYTRFSAAKKNGAQREILAPKAELKTVQRKILDFLLIKVPLNNHAEGFRKNRSIVTNAQRHTDKKVLIKMDIKDFFPSTKAKRVFGMFFSLGYPEGVASTLTNLTTFKGRLATGAPTSPAISNVLCRRLDKRFARLGEKCDFSYSRYADDLTVSSNNTNLAGLLPLFKEIVLEEGYELNENKLRIMRSGSRQKVTGVVVNIKPNIDKNEIRKLRAVVYNCRHKDINKEIYKWAQMEKSHPEPSQYTLDTFKRSVSAKINFVKMVNHKAGEKLLADFKALSWPG
nr:RNA-directed DNA polymerase [Desulfobulbaceae bacterium]